MNIILIIINIVKINLSHIIENAYPDRLKKSFITESNIE